MKYYLSFYKDKDSFMVKADEFDNKVKTNFEDFNALIFLEEKVEHDKITDYKLIIEKEEKGVYNYMSSFSGRYNYNDGTVEFEKCSFKKSISNNANFRIYVELYEGGIRTYNGKDKLINVILRKECVDFKVDIEEAKKILDVFEIENELINEINIKITSQENSKFNTFMYHLEINKNEVVIPEVFLPFGNKEIEKTVELQPEMFLNNETYIHVFLKDSFNNIKYNKYHLITKNSKFTCFEIKDEIKKIRSLSEEISLFFEERTVESLIPIIQTDENTQIKSEKKIGLLDKRNGYFNMTLAEYFPDVENIEECILYFAINETKITSNSVYIDIDSKEPKIFFNNLDEDNYQLIKEDIDKINLSGVIEDKNFFYIGSSSLKCDFENIGYNYIVKGNSFDSVSVNGSECIYIKGHTYSYVISQTYGQLNFLLNGEPIVLDYIDDSNEGGKSLFVIFNKNELSTHENNIIATQGGLKLKNSKITSQRFFEICDKYIIKAIFPEGTVTTERIDIGIDNFEYSFLRKLEKNNVSCELTGDKKFILDYTDNKLVLLSKFDEDLIKYNQTRILSKRKGFNLEALTLFPVALGNNENFTTKNNVVYIDNTYNEKDKSDIYGAIILSLNEEEIEAENLNIERVNESSFLFTFNVPIGEGINNFITSLYDENGNLNQNSFVIEKSNKNIKLDFQKESKNYNILEKEEHKEITTNKDKFTAKIFVLNETYKQKNQDNFIGVYNGSYEKQYKIFNDRENRVALIELDGNIDEKKYEIYYINGDNKDIVKTLKKDFIKVYTEDNVITGLKEYNLYIEKDNFVKINVENNNENIKVEYDEIKERIKITRVNNEKVIEKDTLKIFAYDENNIYKPYKKEVTVEFYNENIIEVEEVSEDIYNPTFDIKFNISFENEVDNVYYYDEIENDMFKRKKTYEKYEGKYIIRNISTPIEVKELFLYVVFKNGVEIKKEILKNNNIKLKFIENNYKVSYKKNDENLVFKIKNNEQEIKNTNIIIKYNKTEKIFPSTFESYETLEFEIDDYPDDSFCVFEIYHEYNNKRYKIYNEIIPLEIEVIDFEILKLPIISMYSLKDEKIFDVVTKDDVNKIKIKTISDLGITKEFKIIDKKINFDFNDKGIYEINIYYEDSKINELIATRIMQVYIDKEEYLDFNIDNFKKFSFISSIKIKNKSILTEKDLSPSIEYHLNNKNNKNIYPKIINQEMQFILPKNVGRNEYYYKDKNGILKLADINISSVIKNKEYEFDINKEKNEIYGREENTYIFEKSTDLTIDIKGVKKINIYSYKTKRTSVQYLTNKKETKINAILLPCKIYVYDLDSLNVNTIEVLLNEFDDKRFKLINNRIIKTTFKNKFMKEKFEMKKDTFNLDINYKKKHRLYHFFNGFALFNNIKEWSNLSEVRKNDILIELDNQAYDKRSLEKTNENLRKLFIKYFK